MALYLVTGGAGFIGSHLVEALVVRGERVRVVDNLSSGKRANLAHLPQVEFLEGDLGDASVARHAMRDVTCVLHQAAIASVPRSVADPIASNHANVTATLNVLVAARQQRVARVIYAASSSAYGDTAILPTSEDTAANPLSPYGLQKFVAEEYCRLFTRLYGVDTVVTRYFNVYGPRQDPASPYSGVISLFAEALIEGRPVTVYGDGTQTRDFTHVRDVVNGVLSAATIPNIGGSTINLATGQGSSLNDVAALMAAHLGGPLRSESRAARAGDIQHSVADIRRATTLLGYQPRVSLREGLADTLDWYRGHRLAA